VLLEGALLAAVGAALGLLLGHAATEAIGLALADGRARVPVTGWTLAPEEGPLVLLIVGLGALAALVPAVQAYRTDLARTLAEG
jgi:putative ABC transport system permease protein